MVEEAVTPGDIARVVSRWTGIPIERMLEGEREKLLRMEEALSRRVVGQREAIEAVSTAVRRARAGLQGPNRPICSFIFLGPTGKTELTKALAGFLFDDENVMVRINMNEYTEKHSVARLIGTPPGYVGHEEGGALTEAVRRRPYQVVLFDEIEKAHSDVFNVLLQVLDDGRLTDGQGRTVDFKNSLIIMTSNIGSDVLANLKEGEDTEAVRPQVMAEVRALLQPELLNRIDGIILFHRLKREQMGAIVDIQIERLQKLLSERKITLHLDDAARTWLAHWGYDPTYGARPLKQVLKEQVQDPLADRLLAGKIKYGDTIKLGVRGGTLVLNGEPVQAVPRGTGVSMSDIPPKKADSGQERKRESPKSGRVFISYRRDDSAGSAGRVHDWLERELGRDLLFMDVDAIPLGANFAEFLNDAVSKCEVLLALIGSNWLDASDKGGNRRIDDANDFVRIEIVTALKRNIPVIPVLLDGAKIPAVDQLPVELRRLSHSNGLEVRHISFKKDIETLIAGLNRALGVDNTRR
jgi:MoxR-like ATPase